MTANSILKQALKLPKGQRLKIAEELFESAFDRESLIDGARKADAAWRAYRRGEMSARPLEEVMQKLRKRKVRRK